MKKQHSILQILTLTGCALVLTSYGGSSIAVPDNQIPIKELRLFSDIYKRVKQSYVEEVPDNKLFRGAIKGMIQTAQPESTTVAKTDDSRYKPFVEAVDNDDNSGATANLPLKKLRLLSNLYGELTHQNDTVEGEVLFEGAIHGMLSTLDPYSTYLKKRAYENLKIGTDGKFGGLGIVVAVNKKDDSIKIMEVLNKTPAQRAGLKRYDKIIKINDSFSKDMSLTDAVDLMRGKKGTKINLLIEREGRDEPFPVTLKRDIVKRESVKYVSLENNIGYVRISNFQLKTSTELQQKLKKLQTDSGLNGIILDLRLNPGGVLNEAVAVSDVFLQPNQLVVYTQGRKKASKTEYRARMKTQYPKTPLIVLINNGSASASEIVTGALKDHGRAVIMGQKSFGKASVQTVLPIDKTSALKLTTARYYTPAGSMIDKVGIMPDIVIDNEEDKHSEETSPEIKEEQSEAEAETKTNEAEEADEWISFEDRIKQDPQVGLAVSKLNTMIETAKKS